MLRLRDLVDVPELGITVSSGEDALDREVRWVNVSELANPSPYVREGDVVLTNGLWLTAETSPARYVSHVARSRASGLMFGLRTEQASVPESLRAACGAAGLPLLVVPVDVSNAAVSEAVSRLRGEEREREMVLSMNRGNALLQALTDGGDASDVLRILARNYSLPVALVDDTGQVLAAEGLALRWRDCLTLTQAMSGPSQADVRLDDGTVCAVFPLAGAGAAKALLVCGRPVVDLTGAERSALQQASRFLALEVARRQALAEIESRFAHEILEMLSDTTRLNNELPGRLRSFGIDPHGPLVIVSVAFSGSAPQVIPGLAETVGRFWRTRGAAVVVPQGPEDAVAILGWSGGTSDLTAAAHHLIALLEAELREDAQPVVGIGRIYVGTLSLPRSLLEAREARRVAQRRPEGPAVVGFDHAGSHRMLLALHEQPALAVFAEAVLAPVWRHDRERGTELVRTLRTFLDHGGHWNTTAEILHIHVNTLRNRVTRIENLLGRDLDSTEDRVDLYLALEISDRGA